MTATERVTPRPLVTVWTEERAEGSFVILRTDRGGQVHYGPFVEDGVEAAISRPSANTG